MKIFFTLCFVLFSSSTFAQKIDLFNCRLVRELIVVGINGATHRHALIATDSKCTIDLPNMGIKSIAFAISSNGNDYFSMKDELILVVWKNDGDIFRDLELIINWNSQGKFYIKELFCD